MAKKKKAAKRTRKLSPFHAGMRVQEGTIVEVHDGKALIGREPTSDMDLPTTGETTLFIQGRKVFLPGGQAFIPLASLHRLTSAPAPKGPTASTSEYHFQVFQDAGGLWRWRIKAINGRVVADSAEGYATKSNAHRAADDLNNTDWPIPVGDL
jgi:uncharacterized protein YegP (UPF0339 family)